MRKVIGIVGWKDVGKTFVVTEIIKLLVQKGYKVGSIKHAHHNFDIDKPNTDSFLHRKAGSQQVIVSSKKRWAKIVELNDSKEKTLIELLSDFDSLDIVIIEGFKKENHPKIEIIAKNLTNSNNQIKNVVQTKPDTTPIESHTKINESSIISVKTFIKYTSQYNYCYRRKNYFPINA